MPAACENGRDLRCRGNPHILLTLSSGAACKLTGVEIVRIFTFLPRSDGKQPNRQRALWWRPKDHGNYGVTLG
jgi:hypothetical protein